MAKREKKGKEQWDQLLEGIDCKGLTPEEVLGQEGRIKQLTGRVLKKILEAERDEHLGSKKHDHAGDNRNGHRAKTVLSENQELELNIPRDRQGTFEPPIIPKYQKRAAVQRPDPIKVPFWND
jgi:transposase-like protein